MYLIDTNVISEARRRGRADPGVLAFFDQVGRGGEAVWLSAVTIGELRRGVESIRRRGDAAQANALDAWLATITQDYASSILAFDADCAQVWGRLCGADPSNAIDKQIAACALMHDLTVVTRNVADFAGTGVRVLNPFSAGVHEP